jgi:hypothetical protein
MPTPDSRANNDVEKTLRLVNRAAEATQFDPFQSGFLVELPAEGELLVTGDVHGNVANLHRILQLADLPRYPQRHLVLQELVHEIDAVDEVCRSYRLVEVAAQIKSAFPDRVHILLGNHEFCECLNLEIGKGGRELCEAFDEGLRGAYGVRSEEVKEAYKAFWKNSPVAIRTSTGVFVSHSTPRLDHLDGLSLDYLRAASTDEIFRRNGPVFSMLWDRDYRPESAESFAQRMQAEVLVVGHTACPDGVRIPNVRHVILDCKDMEGRYALLPLDRELGQRQVLTYVRKLYE